MSGLSRRAFLRTGAGAAAAFAVGRDGEAQGELPPRSRVVLIRDPELINDDGTVNGPAVRRMLNDAVVRLVEAEVPSEAWATLFRPGDVVGIKSNVWRYLPTPPALEEAIRDAVRGAGVKPEDVGVDDRGVRTNPLFERATALVNIRPMRTHHWSGLGTLIKNYIMFVPSPPAYHGDACATLGAIWKLPELEGKTRLNVLVMLTPQFHGVGPHSFSERYVWPYAGLIVSRDPVAADATGARIIAAKRREFFGEERPISPPPHHIEIAAERYGLGVADPDRIELIRLGSAEAWLI